MSNTDESACPSCGETNFMRASVSDDIASTLDAGSGVVFVSCNGCGDRLTITVRASTSRSKRTDETGEGSACPSCAATNILAVELAPDALIQLEQGYVLFDVECMDCNESYTVEATVENIDGQGEAE